MSGAVLFEVLPGLLGNGRDGDAGRPSDEVRTGGLLVVDDRVTVDAVVAAGVVPVVSVVDVPPRDEAGSDLVDALENSATDADADTVVDGRLGTVPVRGGSDAQADISSTAAPTTAAIRPIAALPVADRDPSGAPIPSLLMWRSRTAAGRCAAPARHDQWAYRRTAASTPPSCPHSQRRVQTPACLGIEWRDRPGCRVTPASSTAAQSP